MKFLVNQIIIGDKVSKKSSHHLSWSNFFPVLAAFLLLFSTSVYAQETEILGTVVDVEGIPLPGASIVIKGTTTGTQTDFDGNYSIEANTDDILMFRYI